ncbi:hypothetical protein JL722_2487 [Aureococcus anophagefferens]|nr:hypothetical protein JL722_2487 [Aureococcus anophagefferens]
MSLFGCVVVGPPGAGKSTMCAGLCRYHALSKRPVALVNLDPACEGEGLTTFAIDVRDFCSVDRAMAEQGLGANGALLFCMKELEQSTWLRDEVEKLAVDECFPYVIFDLPGQTELFTHDGSLRRILDDLKRTFDARLVAAHLVDVAHCGVPSHYVAACLLSLTAMLRLELPHINVLSKVDLADRYELAMNLEFFKDARELHRIVPFCGANGHPAGVHAPAALVEDATDLFLLHKGGRPMPWDPESDDAARRPRRAFADADERARRAAAGPHEVEEQQDAGPKFDADLLRMYYARLFPYEQMCKWLAYQPHGDASTPVGTGSTLAKRELSLTLADDVYIRYQCFDAKAMKELMTKRQPHKIDIGAVFNASPKDHLSIKNFRPEERELVFDIDLSDYDDACGPAGAASTAGSAESRKLTNEARLAIIKYFSVVGGNENSAKKTDLQAPLHPSLERAYKLLEPLFIKHVIPEDGQKLLASPEHWSKLLATLPEDIADQIAKHWARAGDASTPAQKWDALKGLCASPDRGSSAKKQKRAQVDELWKYEVVFTHCYPRLDENVSKHRNHLLKSPFARTEGGASACPSAKQCAAFDPTAVVTLKDLAKQIDASTEDVPDLEKTDLKHAVRFFERASSTRLKSATRASATKEQQAAMVGDCRRADP